MSTASDNRPLSPHLQIYRPQLTSILSILHRATGIFLSLGTLLLAAWLIALSGGGEAADGMDRIMGSWFGMLALLAWSYALFYHLCNGIRHLVWDAGKGLDLKSVYVGGYIMVAASVLLTAAVWAVALL